MNNAQPETDNDGQAGRRGGGGPVTVETARIRIDTVTETVSAVGTTRAASSVNIVPTVAGLVTAIRFRAGQTVEPGDVLIELDNELEQASVGEADSELANLRQQINRAESLRAQRLLSAAELDDLRSQANAATARLQAARSRFQKRTVTAPFSGTVGLANFNVGDYVDSDDVITTLDDLSVIELEFKVPERYFSQVSAAQPVAATSIAFPDRQFGGSVQAIDTRIEPTTRAFRVRAELPNPDAVLPDGLFMAVRLTIAERPDALLIPEEALINEQGTNYVYQVSAAGTASKRTVTLGQRLGDWVEITDGIDRDLPIVTRGHQSLRDEAEVRLTGDEVTETVEPATPTPQPS